jgi:hypothetical protein
MSRPKAYFFFYSPLQAVFSSPTASDTTLVSTASTTRTTAKTYTLNIPSGANTIRVIIYGYVDGATGYIILNINGVDVASASTTSTSETIVIDYIGSISPGTRTIRIDYYISQPGLHIHITKVYIATGIGVTTTTLSDLITFSVTYQLVRSGDIRYSPGVRIFIYGNRKTTAPATLQAGTNPTTGRNQLRAGNDNTTTEVFLAIVTGSVTFQEGGEFTVTATLRGAVGASGNVVIVTRILARAQLRRLSSVTGQVEVYERGVLEYSAVSTLVSVPGGSTSVSHFISRRDLLNRHIAWIGISGSGTNVTLLSWRAPIVAPMHFATGADEDHNGEGFLEWVQVVVWG